MNKKAILITLIGLVLSLTSSAKPTTKNLRSTEKPNFIIINIDDLGYGDTEPFGSTLNHTPNLSRMADEGVMFTSFYADPVCSPSRSSLMTGCYSKRVLPLEKFYVLFPADSVGLSPDEITIAELLKEQGYSTGMVGKWHLGDQDGFLPTDQGFDYYFGIPYSNDMGPVEDGARSSLGNPLGKNPRVLFKDFIWGDGYPPLPFIENKTFIKRILPEDQQSVVSLYTKKAINFIQNNYQQPFFLYLAHTAVHWPYYPGKEFRGHSSNGVYGDWVEEMDWSVGKILEIVKELGIDKNTLIIFTSDNGANGPGSNLPLRGEKNSIWEGGVRVPFIARWPEKIIPETRCDAVTGMIDILPTFVKLAGGEAPKDRKIDGKDIWPLLSGEICPSPHDVFYYYLTLKLEAVRMGNWKLHLRTGNLYNLESDISERNNVADKNEEIVREIEALANEMDSDLGKGGPSRYEGVGPGCRALGKVTNPKPIIDKDGKIRSDFSELE